MASFETDATDVIPYSPPWLVSGLSRTNQVGSSAPLVVSSFAPWRTGDVAQTLVPGSVRPTVTLHFWRERLGKAVAVLWPGEYDLGGGVGKRCLSPRGDYRKKSHIDSGLK